MGGRIPQSARQHPSEPHYTIQRTPLGARQGCRWQGREARTLSPEWLRLEVALFERLAKLASLPPSVSAEDAASARPLASVPAAVSAEEAASAAEHQAVFAGSMRPRAWVLDTTELETEVRATAAAVARSDGRLSVETELLVHGTLPWTSNLIAPSPKLTPYIMRWGRRRHRTCVHRRAPPDSHALQRLSWR